MIQRYIKGLACAVLFMCSCTLYSQDFTDTLYANQMFYHTIETNGGSNFSFDGNPTGGEIIVDEDGELSLTPDTDWTGVISFDVQWLEPPIGFPPIPQTKSKSFEITYVNSIVDAEDDAIIVSDLNSYDFDPLANDSISLTDYTVHLTQTLYGTCSILNDTFTYAPVDNIDKDYINYTIVDSLGTHSRATVYVVYEDLNVPSEDSLYYSVSESGSTVIMFTHGGYELEEESDIASVEGVNSAVFKYSIEEETSEVGDTLSFIADNGNSRTVFINIIQSEDEGLLVEDDIYTAKNTSVSFNPLDNDDTESDIVDFSDDLVLTDVNTLTYTPPTGFVGVKKLWYEVDLDGTTIEKEDIYIYVGDMAPQYSVKYEFNTLKNTDLVISYEVPLEGYSFEEQVAPMHGTLYFEDGEISDECNEYSVVSSIRYTPFTGFIGNDEFTVKYCINGSCNNYKVYVEILDIENDDCVCEGPDCVWAGDLNKDGKVSVRDILPLGMCFGNAGTDREDSGEWLGNFSDNWDSDYYNGINGKNADANGDGIIDIEDLDVIEDNYSLLNNFVPLENYYLKDYPLLFDFQQTEVDSGDLLLIDVILGNEAFPVIDMEGFAFNLSVAEGIADSASMDCVYHTDSWLANNASNVYLNQVPQDGTIESGFTRTSGLSASGYGVIATLSFIVEDEIEGFKLKNSKEFEFNINMSNVVMQGADGRVYRLPNTSGSATLRLKNKEEESTLDIKDLIVFPNPAQGYTTIHMNDGHQMYSLSVLDLQGRIVSRANNINSNSYQLITEDWDKGLYSILVETDKGTLVKKLMVR